MQEFIDMLSLYKGVEVQFSESNKYVSITLAKYTDCWGGASPEVGFYWGERSVDITGTDEICGLTELLRNNGDIPF